jgi:3-carboxy-cis,cis-muconate cycloisomerase
MSLLQHAFWDDACAHELSDEKLLAAMARFEGALAKASVGPGLVPAADAETIARVAALASFDAGAIAKAARRSATIAIPLVKSLTEQVAVTSAHAARYVHFGATSQDVVDTGVVLCLGPASERLLSLSKRVGDAAAELARRHAKTPMVARTLLQPAVPVSFGWKAAVWLSGIARAHAGFAAAVAGARKLQFGGAGGTLSSFGQHAEAIAGALASELGLARTSIPWHSQRDGFARLGAESAILAGAGGKIARDISLLMQPEIGEVAEPSGAGRGGSSAMPHKRNPVASVAALAAAQRAPHLAAMLLAQLAPEHERGLGQWQGQWFTLRDLLCSTAGALAAMAEALEGLHVDEQAMRANLERSGGLVYSEGVALHLARTLGKQAAHALTEKLCETAVRERRTLAEVLRADPQAGKTLDAGTLESLFDPQSCLGSAPEMIERALADWTAALKH